MNRVPNLDSLSKVVCGLELRCAGGITTGLIPAGDCTVMFRTLLKCAIVLALVSATSRSYAQQGQAAQAPQSIPAASQPAAPTALRDAATPGKSTQASDSSTAQLQQATAAPTDLEDAKPLKSQLTVPHELSPWSMFMSADILVKLVMSGLALASLVTWTTLFAKTFELSVVQRKLKGALKSIGNARSLAEAQFALGERHGVLSLLLAAAMHEARLSVGISTDSGIKERAASHFAEISRAEGRRIRLGMGMLATIGSTAPFVGLFGTVWGIMNSFIGISKAQTTNLAVVAPGIAEALLATAIGLAAAIPAVIIYNHFARVTKTYLELVARASGAAARLLSRDLDRGSAGVLSRAAE
jgi:biopolymer transport protein ExbB